MEFMGISIGILALICTAMLLFGRTGTVKILAWLALLAVLGIGATVGFIVWWPRQCRCLRRQCTRRSRGRAVAGSLIRIARLGAAVPA